ncbi:MAG: hypothetical protein IJD91_01275 [Clostridia bacterium]|nr:hypothetical protein [Clostridia bacterium]
MSKSFKIDLTGQRFGRLIVLEFVPNEKRGSYWLCRCDCGNEKVIRGNCLITKHTESCGCLFLDVRKASTTTHGNSNSRLYSIWKNMKQRCNNPNASKYGTYGGRGICVCDEWLNNFPAFRTWALSHGYADNLSIDRIDNNKGYFPENCRWADNKTQCRNLRKNVLVKYEGKLITISEVAEITGISKETLYYRFKHGYSNDQLFRPVKKSK